MDEAQVAPDGLMVFDGVCNLCSGAVRFVLRHDREGRVRFTPIQSPYGRLLCEQHGVDPDRPSTFLFFEGGRALEGSDALAAMLARLPPPWRGLRALKMVPRSLRDGLYRWIARNRYRLFGRRDSCYLPTPEQRARFLHDPPQA